MTAGAAPPLDGVTVLSFEHAIAAPLCTRQLAELGARVIKVERRETGDFARRYDDRVKGQSSHFIWTNRSKESLTLDIKHPRAREIVDRLLPGVDVLVQNLAPAAMERLGLDHERLRGRFKRLIVCGISGYGKDGPFRSRKAYDLLVQAEAGFLSVTGTGEAMVKSGVSIADIAAAMQAHGAILAALIRRADTGQGCGIEISMLEALVEWMGFPLLYAADGAAPPPRAGADHASIYPYGAFRDGDGGMIMLGVQNEREWASFCGRALERPALAQDPRFRDNPSRSRNREALRDLIQETLSSLSGPEVRARLDGAGIAWADVNDMAAVWAHPQLRALGRFTATPTPEGPASTLKPPWRNSGFEPALGAVPAVGEHTGDILAELGFSAAEIEAFRAERVV